MTDLVRFKYEGRDYCFEHPTGDHIGRVQHQTHTFYELDLLEHLRSVVGVRPGVVVDVGAHVGNHTIYFANHLGPVLAFEPNREIFGLLVRNVERAAQGAVSLVSGAFWDAPARFATRQSVREKNTGTNTVAVGSAPASGAVLTFDYHTLHALPIKLVKIDVEGAEDHVLAGLRPVLEALKPVLALEAATAVAFRAQQAVLGTYGYRHAGPFCKTPTYVWTAR